MRKYLATSAMLLAASALAAAPASAAILLNDDGSLSFVSDTVIGDSYTFNFDGSSSGTSIDGLTSSLTLTFNGITGSSWSFLYGLTNTSGSPLTSSNVMGFGFDVDPNLVTASVTGGFNTVGSGLISNGTKVEACFKDGQGNNCAGGGNTGFGFGQTAAGTFALGLPSGTNALTFSNLIVRYQGINGPGINGGSGIGVPLDPLGAVPEPATWAMMLLGFGFVGGALRSAKRRRKVTVSYA